ncbi:MAG: MerR family transcriptional regulator [Clostridia bacterium]|nr:MerR family transcriptional regulator [Clostridia bacterium]
MKIGEFARVCGTKISVLRHYDKEKLLVPSFTDQFSGYRHYTSQQILDFHRITALKNAGFSLQEIKELISSQKSSEEIADIFARKEKMFAQALENLKEAALMMTNLQILFTEKQAIIELPPDKAFLDVCTLAEAQIRSADYQRISQYKIKDGTILCDIVKLDKEVDPPEEKIPFVNDEQVVGKWEIIGIFAVREDFYDNLFCVKNFYGEEQKYLYFLPNGERYWAYSWTKGVLNSPINNEYETEQIGDALYMFVNLKEYEYTRGGEPTCLVLKKVDSNRYTVEEIARKDNTSLPFVADDRVIGTWKAHSFLGYLHHKADFTTEAEPIEDLYFKEVTFYPDGNSRLVYEDAVFEGADTVTWTKNYLLRHWNWSACEYEIRTVDNVDYLIVEWKSGDWRYGGYDTNYYVFTRA